MFIIGLLLVAAAVVFGIELMNVNGFHTPTVHVFGTSLGIHTVPAIFVVGAIAGAAAMLGLMMVLVGLRYRSSRAVARRRERKQAQLLATDRDGLEADNARLRQELEARDAVSEGEPRSAARS